MIDCLFLAEYFLISCVCFVGNIIYNNERKTILNTHTHTHTHTETLILISY
jgi:hypothetical protein